MIFFNFTIFWLWEHIAREWEVIEFCENSWSSFNSLETNDGQTFWHKLQDSMTTQPPAIRSQTRKIGKFVKIMAQTFLNCDNMCDLTVLLASICYRKTAARPFDTICDILRALRLVQSLLKGRNAPIWRIGNRGVKLDLLSNLYSKIVNKIWNYRALRGSRAHSEALGPDLPFSWKIFGP